ncbi:MAG: glycosyltransferase family 9 protein [Mycobacteriales bacterium]
MFVARRPGQAAHMPAATVPLPHPGAARGRPVDWAELRRILVVRADNLGDVLMAGPALRALRRAAPRATLTLLAAPAGAGATSLLPEVGAVLVVSPSWQQLGDDPVDPAGETELVDRIAAGRHDAAVVLTSFSQSPWPAAYACVLAGVPVRVGMSKEFGGALLTHWVPAVDDAVHQVDRMLAVLAAVGVPAADRRLTVRVPSAAVPAARAALATARVSPGTPYAVLLPGASCPSRRWPPARFAATAGLLAGAGLVPVVAGPAAERELVLTAAGPSGVPLGGALDVPGLAALLAGAEVAVVNNSGGLHLAAAVGTPVVCAFAGTELESQYAPRDSPAVLLRRKTACSPCRQLRCPYGHECLDLSPAEVAGTALRLTALRRQVG